MSKLEAHFALLLLELEVTGFVREHRFDTRRRWRFDFAHPGLRIAVECEGGTYTNGRHVRPKGYQADCVKYNAATTQGWRVLRYTTIAQMRAFRSDFLKLSCLV